MRHRERVEVDGLVLSCASSGPSGLVVRLAGPSIRSGDPKKPASPCRASYDQHVHRSLRLQRDAVLAFPASLPAHRLRHRSENKLGLAPVVAAVAAAVVGCHLVEAEDCHSQLLYEVELAVVGVRPVAAA